MRYVNFEFYKKEYKGTLISASDDFESALIKAQSKVDHYTSQRLKNSAEIPIEVKMCCCELCELEFQNTQAAKNVQNANGVKSESVGGWSKTYEGTSEKQARIKNLAIECQEVITRWLYDTGLLYGGLND